MKLKGLVVAAALACSLPSVALAQRQNGSFVVDLRTYTVVAVFDSGDDVGGAMWTTTSTAYIVAGQALRRLSVANPMRPFVSTSTAPLLDPTYYIGVNAGDAAVNARGTRMYLGNVLTTTPTTAVLLAYDTSTRNLRRIGVVAPPTSTASFNKIEAIKLYHGDRSAIITNGTRILFANIVNDVFNIRAYPFPTTDQIDPTFPPSSIGVQVIPTSSTAIVSNLNGGMQAFSYATLPPQPLGGVIAPPNCFSSPSLTLVPERVTGIGQPRMAGLICTGNADPTVGPLVPSQVSLISFTATSTPTVDHTITLPSTTFNDAQAISVNPVTGELYVAATNTQGTTSVLGTSSYPWTGIDHTIPLTIPMNVGRAAIGVSPDGRYLIVVGWRDL